jgi:hypothetical protein
MITKSKSLALAACLALALGSQFSLRADDAPPARQRPSGDGPRGPGGFGFRGPGFDSLSQDEKDKLKAASEKAMQDDKVKAAREKMEAAGKEFRDALQAAQIAADPTVEPVLKKLQEAREKAMQERASGRGETKPPEK